MSQPFSKVTLVACTCGSLVIFEICTTVESNNPKDSILAIASLQLYLQKY